MSANIRSAGPAVSRVPSEDERDWRVFRLSKLGAGDWLAAEIALSDVDVHDVERLLAAACPLELAWEILR